MIQTGRLTRDQVKLAEASVVPTLRVLDEFAEDMRTHGRSAKHTRERMRLARLFVTRCPAKHIGGIRHQHIEEFLATVEGTNRNHNVHLNAIKGMFAYACRGGRYLVVDPSAEVRRRPETIGGEGVNVERAATRDEYQAIVTNERAIASRRVARCTIGYDSSR